MRKSNLFFISWLFITAGCHNHPAVQSHEHEEIRNQYAVYSADIELFVEADPFVSGKKGNVLAHFTTLSDFKALDSSYVTSLLVIGGKELRETTDTPVRKGIYRFVFQPGQEGVGQLIFRIHTHSAEYEVSVPGIQVFASEEEADEAAEKNQPSQVNSVVFTKEQSWKIDFSTGYAKQEPFGQVIKSVARIETTPGNEMIIASKTSGLVMMGAKTLLEGSGIKKGEYMLTVSGSGMVDNNISVRYLEAQNNFQKARADYERMKTMSEEKIVSEKELLNARNNYENCRVVYENLEENFSLAGQKVISPMTGFVRQMLVKNGQYVDAGQPLMVVCRDRSLLLTAAFQQKHSLSLGSIVSATIRMLPDNRVFSLDELHGRIISVGQSFNSPDYRIPVSFEIDNPGGFIPGSLVEIDLKTKSDREAMTVPVSALIEEQGVYFVFVQVTPELFEKREVRIGTTDGQKTEIVSGISLNDRIVIRGAIMVKLAKNSGALDPHAGHVH